MKHILDTRLSTARSLHSQGYNCAQSVALAFDDVAGLDTDTLARCCAAMGAGCSCGEICGAAAGMGVVIGSRLDSTPGSKIKAMQMAAPLMQAFKDGNGGRIRCSELKGKTDTRSCDELIAQAVTLLHERLAD